MPQYSLELAVVGNRPDELPWNRRTMTALRKAFAMSELVTKHQTQFWQQYPVSNSQWDVTVNTPTHFGNIA